MPTVSTVEKTASARFASSREASTRAKSPEYPPPSRTTRSRSPRFGTLAGAGLEAGLEVVPDLEAAAPELVEPVQAVPRRVSLGRLQRLASERGVAVEDEERSPRLG